MIREASAQVDTKTNSEMATNMMICSQQQATKCSEICRKAYRSFSDNPSGNQKLIAQCQVLVEPVRLEAEAQKQARKSIRHRKKEAGAILRKCRGKNKDDCRRSCKLALEQAEDQTLFEACRAAQPPSIKPKKHPGILSFAKRAERMETYAQYCEAKKASGQFSRGDRGGLEYCINACRNSHVTDSRIPKEQQESYLENCERSYNMLRANFGD